MMLISLDQASRYCRRDTTFDDAELTVLVQAASQRIAQHLLSGYSVDFMDSDGEPVAEDSDGVTQDVDAVVQAATLYLTAWMYRHRDEDEAGAFGEGHLPAPVRALLGMLRDPVMS